VAPGKNLAAAAPVKWLWGVPLQGGGGRRPH